MRVMIVPVLLLFALLPACATTTVQESCTAVPEALNDSLAYDILSAAPRVWADGWGIAGAPSCYAAAYRHLLSSPNAVARFERLFNEGTPAAKLYAIAGLSELDAAEAKSYIESDFARSPEPVDVFEGCSNLPEPVSKVVARIRARDFSLFH